MNIPGNKWQEGETLIPYKGPAPGPESGYHRYIFLLYHQAAGKMEFEGEERCVPQLPARPVIAYAPHARVATEVARVCAHTYMLHAARAVLHAR